MANSGDNLDNLIGDTKPHRHTPHEHDGVHQKLLEDTQPPANQIYVLKPGLPLQKDADLQPQPDEQTKALYDKVSPAVVKVVVPDGSGSGFFFDKNGDIATDAHVVLGSSQIDVITKDGTKMPAKLVALDDVDDIAVLRVDGGTPKNVAPLELAPKEEIKADDNLWAVGHPLGLDHIYISPGYFQTDTTPFNILKQENRAEKVANVSADLTPKEKEDLKESLNRNLEQTKMHIQPGNSGGPVVDKDGRVIGLADMTNTSNNESQITPSSYLASLMNESNPKFTFNYKFVPEDKAPNKFASNGEYILTDESRGAGDYRPPLRDRFFGGGGKFEKPHDAATSANEPTGQHLIGKAPRE